MCTVVILLLFMANQRTTTETTISGKSETISQSALSGYCARFKELIKLITRLITVLLQCMVLIDFMPSSF